MLIRNITIMKRLEAASRGFISYDRIHSEELDRKFGPELAAQFRAAFPRPEPTPESPIEDASEDKEGEQTP